MTLFCCNKNTSLVQLKIDLQAHFREELHPIKALRWGSQMKAENIECVGVASMKKTRWQYLPKGLIYTRSSSNYNWKTKCKKDMATMKYEYLRCWSKVYKSRGTNLALPNPYNAAYDSLLVCPQSLEVQISHKNIR